ncbi:ninein-like isoform X2 [Dreissena polymorpha]|uniref:ninein-like isoform X2 n=1 Tax=Dreissena polymorpha TaxID=45954 RepID=UPI0022648B98|nr:ninein-like isoform X2 [Dreissena polymorpha]
MYVAYWIFWPPGQNQFPSRYEQLPGIGKESPRSPVDNQLVPLRTRKASPRSNYKENMDLDTEERIRQLEMRLSVSEKSNRALLEEVLRLQSDLRNTARKSDDVFREERESRQQLSEAIRISNELITQLSVRIKETEDKIEDEKASLNTLFSHTKLVEKSVVVSQQEIQQRRDAQSIKLQELKSELSENKSARSQLEQITYALSEELRTLRNKVDNQQAEFSNMITEVRNRARKLEEENRTHLDSMRKQSDMHSLADVSNTQLRGQVEQRLSELRDVLMDLRGKHETEQSERRNLEKLMQAKINELNTALGEQARKREENMHTVDMVLREKEHAAQAEKLQLNSKLSGTVEDVNKRLTAKEMKLKDEIQAKYQQLEKILQREQQSRQEYEKSSREEADRKWQTLRKALEEELQILKESIGTERGKNRDTITKLDQSITIVEKQLAENKKQVDKVMAAEIKSRKIHELGTQEKISIVNDKLQIATSSLQQAIGGVSQNLSSSTEKIKRELKTMLNEQQQGSTRALSDMDARMNAVKQRLNTMEEALDAKVAAASNNLSERLSDRIEAISKWQDATGDTLRELGRSVQTIPQDIYQMEEKFKLLKSEMDSRVSHESDGRAREMEILRQEILNLKSRLDRQPKAASLQDLEAMNIGVRKLADNLQTVKTVLGMKIQSEQKLRISGLQDLQTQINQLKIVTGSSLKIEPMHHSQMDDLDTGLGWDDWGSLESQNSIPAPSRQKLSDPQRPLQQATIEEEREESPFESKGLKNMNLQSPTPKGHMDDAGKQTPAGEVKPATDRRSPGNVTPDEWQTTPRDENKTPVTGRAGKKTPQTGKQSPGNVTPGKKTPTHGVQSPTNQNTTPRNQQSGLEDI